VNRLAAALRRLAKAATEGRKVRATQGIPLSNRKRSARVSKCRRK